MGTDENPSGEEGKDMAAKTLSIDGMMCEHCVQHVTEALEGVRGVKNVHVSLENKNATLDAGLLVSDDKLKKAVADAGYTVTAIK
jgi:P-type Cu2+ transporter